MHHLPTPEVGSRTKCFGHDEFHIQKQPCSIMPSVYCYDCKQAFCDTCNDEFHYRKRPDLHRRSYATAKNLGLRPCIFKDHRKQCKEFGTMNCEQCGFEDWVCVFCIRTHHWGIPDSMGHAFHQIPIETMYPSKSTFSFHNQNRSEARHLSPTHTSSGAQ